MGIGAVGSGGLLLLLLGLEKSPPTDMSSTTTNPREPLPCATTAATGTTTTASPLTQTQVRNLLTVLGGHAGGKASGPPSLLGRPVLVPFGRVAFWEGELRPERVGAGASPLPSPPPSEIRSDDDDEEEVRVAVGNGTSAPEAGSTMSLSAAIQWLEGQRHEREGGGGSSPGGGEELSAPDGGGRPRTPVSAPVVGPSSSWTPSSELPCLVDIQEEYAADGRRVHGEALDVSSRLRAVWEEAGEAKEVWNGDEHDDEHERGNQRGAVDMEAAGGGDGPVDGDNNNVRGTAAPSASDDEYERLSRRLEELALLEEEEEQRRGRGETTARASGRGPSPAGRKKPNAGGSPPLQFKRGFLNTKSSNKRGTANPRMGAQPPGQLDDGPDEGPQRRITIDTTRNTVQEIPRVGRQLPVPSKQSPPTPQRQYEQEQQQRSWVDPQVFSGHVHERPSPAARRQDQAVDHGVVQTTEAAQEPAPPPHGTEKRRVSRFAKERMERR